MGKKMGMNEKAAAKRDDKEATKQAKKDKEAKAKEDAEWRAAGEGAKSKAQANREKQAASKEEAAAKRAEAKRLAAEEEAAMANIGKKKPSKPAAPKMTAYQLQKQKEADAKTQEAAAAKAANAGKRTVTEDEMAQLLEVENINRRDTAAEARSVQDAISLLKVSGKEAADQHPERRMKASHAEFEEAEIARLKSEKPGLRMSQYKEMAWKAWQKSPENPMNQAALAAAQQAAG